ncbi:ROK family protein [Streptomyces sp. NPDC007369]|uniref:ROK family protein n=1 Tax=Streptomyces sp. NPDC007369 TaxID=3154589 RepID=UPI0033CF0441
MRHVIALDVGGTSMKAALMAENGALLLQERRPTPAAAGPDRVVAALVDFAVHLRDHGEREYGRPAVAIGVGVPGFVDEATGTALYAANIGWRDVPLRTLLTDRLGGIPVAVGHDMRTGGLAEARLGAGRGLDRFLFVALGTGISAAIGIDGRFEAGAHGAAGELGHVVVRRGGRACNCGQSGCLETVASASAVARAWAEAGGDPGATAADAAEAVRRGDPRATAVWDDAIAALADGLAIGVHLLDPRALVLGGGLAESGDLLFAPLAGALDARLTHHPHHPALLPAALGDTAGCLGAALLAWDLLPG